MGEIAIIHETREYIGRNLTFYLTSLQTPFSSARRNHWRESKFHDIPNKQANQAALLSIPIYRLLREATID